MIVVHSLLTLGLLIVSSLGPGLFFIRYLRWRPLETLCGSVALSFLLLYLAAFIIYVLALPPTWAYVPTFVAVVATLICASDLRRLWRHRETRDTMLGFLALVAWLLLLLLLVRGYSGADWYGDWYEHYQRTLFFMEHQPLDTKFIDRYILPARPPMMNLLAAEILWQVSPTFELFQVVFAYLNALVILPCALIAPSLVARTRNRVWLIAGFLALSPMFVQNGTFTWTKTFTGFYELTALGLYLSAWRRGEPTRMIAAFACLATGMLVHYSAAPFLLFLAGHYLVVLFWRREHRWRELIVSVALGSAIFATWLGWSCHAYGWDGTFASNTTVTSSQKFSLEGNLSKVTINTFNTVVPFFLRGSYDASPGFNLQPPPKGLAYLRDWCFAVYQLSLPTMLGSGGLILVGWLLLIRSRRAATDPWEHRRAFWLWFVLIVTVAGIAVHGDLNYLGVAHICLQPLVLIGLTLAAVGLPHVPRWLRNVALVGLLIDASLGILLHFYLLQTDFEMSRTGDQLSFGHLEMGVLALGNCYFKFNNHLVFLGDHAVAFAGWCLTALILGVLGICQGLWFLAERGTQQRLLSPTPSKARKAGRKKRAIPNR